MGNHTPCPVHSVRLMVLRRALKTILLTTLCLELAYVLLANALLFCAPSLASLDPQTFRMAFRAYTLVPGIVHVSDFRVQGQDRFVQWEVTVPHARAKIDLPALASQKLRIERATGGDVSFRLRAKREGAELEKVAAHLPVIEGYGPAILDPAAFPVRPRMPHPWWVELGDLDFDVKELWVDEVRYQGQAHASGDWRIRPDHDVEVNPAHLIFHDGTLTRRGVTAAGQVKGTLDASLSLFDPRAVPGAAILEYLDADAKLTLSEVPPALLTGFTDIVALSGPGAEVRIDTRIQKGVVQDGSAVRFALTEAHAEVGELAVGGDLTAEIVAPAAGEGFTWSASAKGVSVSAPSAARGDLVHAGALSIRTSSEGRDLRALKLPKKGSLSLSNATVPDVRRWDAFIPAPLELKLQGGKAEAKLDLALDFEKVSASGAFGFNAHELKVRQGEREFHGALEAKVRLGNLSLTRARIDGSSIALKGMRLIGTGGKLWSARVDVKKGRLNLRHRAIFEGQIAASLSDGKPLVKSFLSDLGAPRWTHGLAPNHVRVSSNVALGKSLFAFDGVDAKIGRAKLVATGRLQPGDSRAAAHLSMGILKLGLELEAGEPRLKTFASRGWYEKKSALVARR